jgi:hypothetical protein
MKRRDKFPGQHNLKLIIKSLSQPKDPSHALTSNHRNNRYTAFSAMEDNDFIYELINNMDKLNPENYYEWSDRMRNLLRMAGVWTCVDPEKELPEAKTEKEAEDLDCQLITARYFISLSVDEKTVFVSCEDGSDGRKLWAALEKSCVQKGFFWFLQYHLQLKWLSLDDSKNFDDFEHRTRVLQWKIEHTGIVLTRENEIIIQLISTLPARYNELRERWINRTIHGTLGLSTCRDNVKQFDEMKAREEKIKQEALAHEKSVPAPRRQRGRGRRWNRHKALKRGSS